MELFPEINGYEACFERYRGFCRGRDEALADTEYSLTEDLPAATSIGSHQGNFWIIFLASKGLTGRVENPLQINAFQYPADYGQRSPSFSRAINFISE